ncbi:glycosyltransferase family 2 protein [Paenibacillus tepidiphilus]|uniref:glycosyltransferase family 2 protein n=1 Tax=Paenibacillus tepidiphilus TaxID=2608683 RepID=UPI0013A5706B|nr:glycosyltransferase family 2 protein [Paenibacillus tepidiphilus]
MSKQPRKPLISLCMIVKNEAESLAGCLNSVRGVADEIIVVDTGSTDATPQIARDYGARVIHFPWNGDFAAARNKGLQRARGTWILVLDADEELEPDSREEVLVCAQHREYEAFFLRVHNHRGLARTSPAITVNPILRMFRNRPEYRFTGIIHEQIASVIVEARPEAAMHLTSAVIHHYGYADGVVARKDKINRNLRLLQEQLAQEPDDAFHHYNIAVEYMRLGEHVSALQHIAESMKRTDTDTSYAHLLYKYKVRCHLALGDSPSALSACSEGIALFPDYSDLHHLRGVLLLQGGALAAANRALREALRIGAPPPAYHTEAGYGTYLTLAALGHLSQETGEDQAALACYAQAARQHPEPWPLIARLVRTLKCAQREHEIPGWLSRHLPEVWAAGRSRILELLLRDGCWSAAAAVIGAGVECSDDGEDSGDACEGPSGAETRAGGSDNAADSSGPGSGVGRSDVKTRAGGSDNAANSGSSGNGIGWSGAETRAGGSDKAADRGGPGSGVGRSGAETRAGRAGTGRFSESILRRCLDQAQQPSLEDIRSLLDEAEPYCRQAHPSVRQSRAWLLLADHVLSRVPEVSTYGAAASRARAMLPLPDVKGGGQL